jgi:pimeloyl-ACP methyl ester carboxylesterase
VRFDYSGTANPAAISRRHHRALAGGEPCGVRGELPGPQVAIGSSMGGWIALLLARELRRRKAEASRAASLAGLVLIAPAVDFTEALMWQRFPPR